MSACYRSTWIIGFGCGLGLVWGHAPARAHTPRGGKTPYSVQLHVHGSFSEGVGSMESHTHEAVLAGVDVIWWSDHDFRTTLFHAVSTFGFEGWVEPIDKYESWDAFHEGEAQGEKEFLLYRDEGFDSSLAEISTAQSRQGTRSMYLQATNSADEFRQLSYWLYSVPGRYTRPLACVVSLDISIFPDCLGPDARAVIEMELSVHPENDAIGHEQYKLRYLLSNEISEPFLEGAIYNVPLAYTAGQWNDYELPITADVVSGFPLIDGEDNSIHVAALGVESRSGAEAAAYFDLFRITQEIDGLDAFEKQAIMLSEIAAGTPEVVQTQGSEISLHDPHLNEFSLDTIPPDYEYIAEVGGFSDEDGWIDDFAGFKTFTGQYVAADVEARGGLVSLNHMFGTSGPGSNPVDTKEEVVANLLEVGVYGVHILEVGYRDRGGTDLADHLWVWDELAKNGYYLIGDGVSDSHGGLDEGEWLTRPNDFFSWIYADSTAKADLLDGLKRARVFFGDVGHFDGFVDLSTEQGFQMGQIVITDRESTEVTLFIDGLNAGDEIRLIESGVHTETYIADSPTLQETETILLNSSGATFVRLEAYRTFGCSDDSNCAKVFSNNLTFVRSAPAGGITPFRSGIDLGGVVSTSIDEFTLTDADYSQSVRSAILALSGLGEDGSLVLDHSTLGPPSTVQFEGLSGAWNYDSGLLSLTGLTGEGSITITTLFAACDGDANGDSLVDPLDSGYILARIGCTVGAGNAECDASDQNGDGLVDPLDVGFVMARFGECAS